MIKLELTEVMKMNNYFLLTPQMEYELQNNLENIFTYSVAYLFFNKNKKGELTVFNNSLLLFHFFKKV